MHSRSALPACLLALAAGPAFAADAVVTNGLDDLANPPAGSLRAAVNQAKANDKITFDASVKNVALVAPIELDVSQSGLKLRGPCQITPKSAGGSTPLLIKASGVAIDDLRFFKCDVQATKGTSGLRVTNCLFSGKGSGISLDQCTGSVIGAPGAKNTFHGVPTAIHSFTTSGVRIEENLFEGCEFAVSDGASATILVKKNTVKGGTIFGGFASGTISENRIEATKLAGIYADAIPSPGLLTISSNVITLDGAVDGIEALGRGALTISGNTIGGKSKRSGITVYRGAGENDLDGDVTIAGNTVIGSAIGIAVDAGRPPGPAITVASNTVGPVSSTGIYVRAFAPGPVQITANIVNSAGKGIKGKAIAIQNVGSTATVAGNTLTGTLGTGILVAEDSTLVGVVGNIVDGCSLHGIGVQTNARASVADCVVKGVKGSGVFAATGAHVAVDGTSFGSTKGPEIDLAPLKATQNTKTKTANDDLDSPEAEVLSSGTVQGTTVPNGRVSLFAPGPDGLVAALTEVTAGGDGKFTIARGLLPPGEFRLLVHAPDDADVSELGPPLEPEPPDDGGDEGEFTIRLIAKAGTTYPPLTAPFGGFGTPVLNNSGEFAFTADLGGQQAIVRGGGPEPFRVIAQAGGAVPGVAGGSFLSSFEIPPVLNDVGQVMFRARFSGNAVDANNNTGIWLDSGSGAALIARRGEAAPGVTNGTFRSQYRDVVLGEQGRVAFLDRVLPDSLGYDSVWVSGSGGPSVVALRDVEVLGPRGYRYHAFLRVQLGFDDAGGASGGLSFSGAFLRGSQSFSGLFYQPTSSPQAALLLAGHPSDGDPLSGDDIVESLQGLRFSVSDGGSDFAVPGVASNSKDGTRTGSIFGRGGQMVAEGWVIAGATIDVLSTPLPPHPLVAANGTTFLVKYELGPGGVTAADNTALVVEDLRQFDLIELAREGSPAPGTTDGALFDDFETYEIPFTRYQVPVVNRAGSYAIRARLRGNGVNETNRTAIYRGRPGQPPVLVARTGTPVTIGGLGRVTPTFLDMYDGSYDDGPSNGADGRGRSLNDTGGLAIRIDFDGTSAIVLVTPHVRDPKPDAILGAIGGGAPVGDNVYGGSSQVSSKPAAAGATVDYIVTIQNDGADTDQFTLSGPPDKAPFSVTYREAGSLADVTAAVRAGTWTTEPLAPGESSSVFASVRVAPNAKTKTAATLSFVARSVADPKASDTVIAKLKVAKAP